VSAEERAWQVVRAAFEERPPTPVRRRSRAPIVAALVVLAAVAAAFASPPGQAVFERVRKAVGVSHAEPALFSLPAPGRLLVVSANGGGVWVVRDNGFKRRIGAYRDAQWSPHRPRAGRPRRGRHRPLDARAAASAVAALGRHARRHPHRLRRRYGPARGRG
jgi:hypothetical protein